jgi:hypothetical protein
LGDPAGKRSFGVQSSPLGFQETLDEWLKELDPQTCRCTPGKFPDGLPTG